MKVKAAIAMSGGVDSSAAAFLMKESGAEIVGLTLKLFNGESRCCSLSDVNDARIVAARLSMPHYVLNFIEAFDTWVIRRFVETYEAGGTPNPCIDCNKYIKFERLIVRALELNLDCVATGHYARLQNSGSRTLLLKARDTRKDQSYFLYALNQTQLAHSRFPLGDLLKEEVRSIAENAGLITARKSESQDICFVPDGNYVGFMEQYRACRYPHGSIIDETGKVLGQHNGAVGYTLGQRRGLGVASNIPLYVCAKNMAANTVTLGPESSLFRAEIRVRDLNLIAVESMVSPLHLYVKTRSTQKETPALVDQISDDEIRVVFDTPQKAPCPGQAVVFYDRDVVIGGGTIV